MTRVTTGPAFLSLPFWHSGVGLELLSKTSVSGRMGVLWRRNRTWPVLLWQSIPGQLSFLTLSPLKNSPPLFTGKGKADRTWQGLLFLNTAHCQVRAATDWGIFWWRHSKEFSNKSNRCLTSCSFIPCSIKDTFGEADQLITNAKQTDKVRKTQITISISYIWGKWCAIHLQTFYIYIYLDLLVHLTGLEVQKYKKKLRKGTNTTLKLNIALKVRGEFF